MEQVINLDFLKTRPLSYSSLKQFDRSPAHYVHYLTAPKISTGAFTMGNLVDCMILTPEVVNERFVIGLGIDRRSNANKALWEEFIQANANKQIVDQEEWDQAIIIKDEVIKSPTAQRLMGRFNAYQQTINWVEKVDYAGTIYEIPMIAKLDLSGELDIGDLKTHSNAEPKEVQRAIFNWDYDLQAGIYMRALASRGKYPNYWWLNVEKTAPYGISVLKASNEFIEYAKEKVDRLLLEFVHCMVNDLWNQTYEFRAPIGYYQMDLPTWLKKKA